MQNGNTLVVFHIVHKIKKISATTVSSKSHRPHRFGEMARRVKVFATKPGDLSLISGMHAVGRVN